MPNHDPQMPDLHGMELRSSGARAGPGTLMAAAIAIAALYFGREVFVPFALAVLLSFALGPAVLFLRHWRFNRVLAVVVVVVLSFAGIVGIGVLLASQLSQVANNLPQYQTNIAEKIRSLRDTTATNGTFGRAFKALTDLGNEIADRPLAGRDRRAGGDLFAADDAERLHLRKRAYRGD